MKRAPLSFPEFLGHVLGDDSLLPEERAVAARLLARQELDPERALRGLVRSLVARGRWEEVPAGATEGAEAEAADAAETAGAQAAETAGAAGSPASDDEDWILRDPRRPARYRLRLRRSHTTGELPERFSTPPFDGTAMPARVPRALLGSPGGLVHYDRILGPREIVARMELMLTEVVPCARARFHALALPTESPGPVSPSPSVPLGQGRLEALANERDHGYRWTASDGGERLLLGLGDDALGWRGCLLLEADGTFAHDAVAAALWIGGHYAETLSTVLRLQGLIFYDFLTGVYNRSYYEDQLDRELLLAKRRREPMALLVIDIDDFRAFNTRYGYDGGDRVLATVACVLKSALRATDTLARYGGEEFVVILAPPVSAEEAARIADRLRAAVAEEIFPLKELGGAEAPARVTVSIGGALYPRHGTSREEIWTRANARLIEAKRSGKNQVLFAE